MEMRHHKLEIMLKDRKIGKSDRKIGSDFEKKKIGSENRIGHFFKIVPSLVARQLINAIFDTTIKMGKQKKSIAQFTVYATY